MKAAFPGTCARSGRRYGPGTEIRKGQLGWEIAGDVVAPPPPAPHPAPARHTGSLPHGQLWQECDVCGTEPVCASCEYCARHCRC